MQFMGKVKKINERSIEIQIEDDNKDVVIRDAMRLKQNLLTVNLKFEHLITEPQLNLVDKLIESLAEALELEGGVDKKTVATEFIKKKFGIPDIEGLCKEEAGMLIDSLLAFCSENNIETGHDAGRSDIIKQIAASNKRKTCIACGKKGESVDLTELKSKTINEWKMGYRDICVCTQHYVELAKTGMEFFKKYHIIVERIQNE